MNNGIASYKHMRLGGSNFLFFLWLFAEYMLSLQ